jgi:hypothetical protein
MERKKDENQTAFSGLEELLRRDDIRDGLEVPAKPPEEKDTNAVKAGKQGGKARAIKLSAKRRQQIAERAARKRWRNT